jgi:flagellar basal-body rod modification protein FlgD
MPQIDPVAATGTPASSTVNRADQFGEQNFLKLLVAQLKYQNPLSPTDGSQFMAQTAQFAMVEQLTQLSKQSTELLASERVAAATGLVGQQVTATTPEGDQLNGTVTAVRFDATAGPYVKVGDTEVPLSAVKEVRRSASA